MIKNYCFLILFLFIVRCNATAQVELVPANHPVYHFLKRMQLGGIIEDYNSAILPMSREEVADLIKEVSRKSELLSTIDKKILSDLKIEFGFEIDKNLKTNSSLLNEPKLKNIFDDSKQKHIFAYADSNLSFFFDVQGALSQRNSKGDSLGSNAITLGELGFTFRGTLFNSVGVYLHPYSGRRLRGEKKDVEFSAKFDPRLKASNHFMNEYSKYDNFEGYIRYRAPSRWISLTIGRELLLEGFGYNDKMLLSSNTVPFDFAKLDLAYKSFKYSFLYGALRGDSLGRQILYKNIVTNRLDIKFSPDVRFGVWESVIVSDNPFSLSYVNPINFIFSSDINGSIEQTYNNNTLLAFDMEVLPVKNLALQGTLLIDDLNLSTLYNSDKSSNDNKLGYQMGMMWNNPFSLNGLTLSVEYLRLSPFVYTHHSNKSQYTHSEMPLGVKLPPNGEEISLKVVYNITNRLTLNLLYQYQRSGEGLIFDSTGVLIRNYGGYINWGVGDTLAKNDFLGGNRINRNLLTLNLKYEPIKQFYCEFEYRLLAQDLLYLNRKTYDHLFFLTVKVDY
ncbi:MAG: capsule assembly Wzi family protein [Ignavibacteria bacterium]